MSKTDVHLYSVEVSWSSHGTFELYATSKEEAEKRVMEKMNQGELPEEQYIYEKSVVVEDYPYIEEG